MRQPPAARASAAASSLTMPCRAAKTRATYVTALGQSSERSTFDTPLPRLCLLRRDEGSESPHMLPPRLGAALALCRPGADQVALNVGHPAEHGDHQAASAGEYIGPSLGQ